jgi:hypothetical protein
MEEIAQNFLNAMKEMIEAGRPAWAELQKLCDDEEINIEEIQGWLDDIDKSIEI